MAISKNDFVEIEFSAKIKNGALFDTTKKEDAKILGINEDSLKPLIISVGNGMLVKGMDEDLVGKDVGKDYSVEIKAENAFGKRDSSLVQMVPLKNFSEQKIYPQRGMQFSLDGRLAKIVSVSGGRVLVDFNNPLAGKDVCYLYKILRKVDGKEEQLDALQEFFFRKKFPSEVKEKIAEIRVDKEFVPLFELMRKRFEEITGLKIRIESIEPSVEKKI
jgi:FKBP-type peptidyl-prolyl cis-trans isomerase 2